MEHPAITKRLRARFNRKVDKRGRGDCWTWKGKSTNNGYPLFFAYNRRWPVHKVAALIARNAILLTELDGTPVGHSCRNMLCVNPEHLTVGLSTERVTTWARRMEALSQESEKSSMSR